MNRPPIATVFKVLLFIAVVVTLAACTPMPKNPEQPVVPEKQTVRIQESLLAPCPPLPRPPKPGAGGRLTEGQIVQWISSMVSAWEVCSVSKDSLTTTIRDAFNIQPLEAKP